MNPLFRGFHGDISLLVMESTDPPPSTLNPQLRDGGIWVYPGVQLSHGIEPIVTDIIQPILSKDGRNHLELFLGKTGTDALETLDRYSATIDSANLPSVINPDEYPLKAMAYNVYWVLMRERISDIPITCDRCNGIVVPCPSSEHCSLLLLGRIQTALLWHVFDVGFRNHRHLEPLFTASKSGQFDQIVSVLVDMITILDDLNPDDESHEWNQRRVKELLHLVNTQHLISSSIGDGAENDSDELVSVAERLNELGYMSNTEFTITGTTTLGGVPVNQYDFAALDRFYQISNLTSTINHRLLPGSLDHLRLLSSNAPRWEEIEDGLAKIDISALTETHTTSWLNEAFARISLRYQRILRAIHGTTTSPTHDITIQSISPNGDQFVVSLTMDSGLVNPPSVTEPMYDRDAMRLILQTLCNDPLIPGSTHLHLSDSVLAREGLCTLRSYGSGVTVSDEYLTVRLVKPLLEFELIEPESLDDADALQESIAITTDPIMTQYIPSENDDAFDYYFDTIVANSGSGSVVPSTLAQGTVLLLGIRGWVEHQPYPAAQDTWCDSIIALWVDGSSNKHFEAFLTSTRPGFVRGFDNIKGDTHLVLGQYQYKFDDPIDPTCLVPSTTVDIRRDPIKCGAPDSTSSIETGDFDVTISAGGTDENRVGRSSRGSQVIFGGDDSGSPFEQFMLILDVNHTDPEFVYTLVDGFDMSSANSATGGGS